MQILNLVSGLLALASTAIAAPAARCAESSTTGIESLLQRRLPQHAEKFEFSIVNATSLGENDVYAVSNGEGGKIKVEGSSLSALATGLHRYLADVAHVDIYWFIGSRLDQISAGQLPKVDETLTGSSVVPYRYHFNTVTTSYTAAFWSWEDWELQLDWMALRGVNLPLAWIGVEKIFIEVFQELGLSDAEIADFLSGPAFLAWNHFGNIQGSWGGSLPYSWVDSQFDLQKKIVKRMVELGMTPILPAFPGFVPRAITRVLPDADVINGSAWEAFPALYTNDTFMEPTDPHFTEIQKSFISKQTAAYGNITTFYTLDQFNENNPSSGDVSYLRNVSSGTWQALKAAAPNATWVMQGWLFSSNSAFWTNDRVEAYLGGVTVDSDLLILDLASESLPQWQRTNSYFGKPWIWCQLHDYGGNMGFYGQVMNITVNPIAALNNATTSLVGFGLSMEGQEGNEIVYDLLLDQAWSATPIDTATYFHDWVTARYAGSKSIPTDIYNSWDLLRTTVYNNTNLTSNAVPKAIFELIPSTSGLVNRTSHHPTTLNYNPADMVKAWSLFYNSAFKEPSLWLNPAYEFDLVDMSRQVLANAFIPVYQDLVAAWNTTNPSTFKIQTISAELIGLLQAVDAILGTNENFKLSTWIAAARTSAGQQDLEDFLEYDAINQITLWGPAGQINDYASKSWAGLVSSYYIPRWKMFIDYLLDTKPAQYNQTAFNAELLKWELQWQNETIAAAAAEDKVVGGVELVLGGLVGLWKDVFSAPLLLFLTIILAGFMVMSESLAMAKRNAGSYLTYSTVKGYFLQDEEDTDSSKFDYVATNFGLINRTYDYEGLSARHEGHEDEDEAEPTTQWSRFERQVRTLNEQAEPNVVYKLLYLGRHGEGFHNVAQSWYGDDAWDCYWSLQNGNETSTWSDARLTQVGKAQAQTAYDCWRRQIEQRIPFPETFYVSPLNRCLETAAITFGGLDEEGVRPFRAVVKELVRETIGIHTCDRRSSRTAIQEEYPDYIIEETLTEDDELWHPEQRESDSARNARIKTFLDDVFTANTDTTFISVTAHSGAITSILDVVGHRRFRLQTGGVIPVLVRTERLPGKEPERVVEPPTGVPECRSDPLAAGGKGPLQVREMVEL